MMPPPPAQAWEPPATTPRPPQPAPQPSRLQPPALRMTPPPLQLLLPELPRPMAQHQPLAGVGTMPQHLQVCSSPQCCLTPKVRRNPCGHGLSPRSLASSARPVVKLRLLLVDPSVPFWAAQCCSVQVRSRTHPHSGLAAAGLSGTVCQPAGLGCTPWVLLDPVTCGAAASARPGAVLRGRCRLSASGHCICIKCWPGQSSTPSLRSFKLKLQDCTGLQCQEAVMSQISPHTSQR